jgi:2-dehydro-3-deoxyphosphogluconate aldolase / (4S)-4-hydroxy-2-oxoglutarate aldolase
LTPNTMNNSGPHQPALETIMRRAPVIPVLTINKIEDAVPLAVALVAGGLPVIEITLRTAVALAAVEACRRHVPEAVIGVGSVVRVEDFARAQAAGAQFAVSPGLTTALAEAGVASGLPFLPGVATASELMHAVSHGFRHLKFFPAEPAGGPAALRSFAGPFADVRFCPTGGIHEGNLGDYLGLANVICVGGSWMAPEDDIRNQAWDTVTARARRASQQQQR